MASFSRGLSCHVGLSSSVSGSLAAGMFRAPPSQASHTSLAHILRTRTFSTASVMHAKYKSPKKRPSPYAKPEFADSKSAVPSKIIVPPSFPKRATKAQPATPSSQPGSATTTFAAPSSPSPATAARPLPKPFTTPVPLSTYAEQLGLRSAPTLLYEAPSHTWYRFITISLGVTFITYSVLNYWDIYLNAPKDILWWVPYAFAGICAFMAAFGAYMFRGTHGIVRTIQAVPTARIQQLCGNSAASQAAAIIKNAGLTPETAPIVLELKVGRMVPVLPPRKRYVLPGALTLPTRLASAGLSESATGAFGAKPAAVASLKDRVLSRRAEEERKRTAREYEMNHLMTAPFRHAGQGASTAWKHVMRAFSHEGFMRATEQTTGKRHKIDITGGWALDNGRALDRLVTVFDDE
ncbi:hypothetical protein F503_06662 [Ophiostoma piceae UAMH 11346]|uniref:Uncharacterized protein n=1 Tax=Ophiostoma piceae (strain UAMH 11346) TaxID=1262450 RepID=S3BQ76_OPHP1|nr:hypothetical protein F503_06662 [Ophiostoma piceae UAMH 11346]